MQNMYAGRYPSGSYRKRCTTSQHARSVMWDLRNAYSSNVHLSKTLDESFYELLDGDDINRRNGDQVLSRFLGRFRLEMEGDEEDSEDDDVVNEDDSEDMNGSDVDGTGPLDEDITQAEKKIDVDTGTSKENAPPAEVEISTGKTKQDRISPMPSKNLNGRESDTRDTQDPAKAPTPSELENQVNQTHRQPRKWLSNIVARFKKHEESVENPDGGSKSETNDGNSESDAGSDTEDRDGGDGEDEQGKRPRQQILILPQLWIWKVENIIVTAFPERWDSSNPRVLPKIMLASVEERNKTAKKEKMLEDMDVQGVFHSVIGSSLGFEPWFSAHSEDRSYIDAFALEISHVSSQTTACYRRYRESLGMAEESFATAMKEETELLMTTDDILSEIAMIKRVQEDQSLVCIAMQAEEDIIAQSNKKDLGESPWRSQGTPTRPRPAQRSLTDNLRPESVSFQESHRNRPAPSPYPNTKLARQEEDAKRVRESIITLLDLRQRQASTENAINSGKQSQILFEQSKVLFIFTGATVIFAPLSWMSGLLALKIESFTPDT
ncbi:hypothetical protein GGR54DRAFT_598383 [Hypoxylon sp. NC1633]|nr:hypothetical protein GGR54DRAFT_598383 [Hypoxylon sp. NC1633]